MSFVSFAITGPMTFTKAKMGGAALLICGLAFFAFHPYRKYGISPIVDGCSSLEQTEAHQAVMEDRSSHDIVQWYSGPANRSYSIPPISRLRENQVGVDNGISQHCEPLSVTLARVIPAVVDVAASKTFTEQYNAIACRVYAAVAQHWLGYVKSVGMFVERVTAPEGHPLLMLRTAAEAQRSLGLLNRTAVIRYEVVSVTGRSPSGPAAGVPTSDRFRAPEDVDDGRPAHFEFGIYKMWTDGGIPMYEGLVFCPPPQHTPQGYLNTYLGMKHHNRVMATGDMSTLCDRRREGTGRNNDVSGDVILNTNPRDANADDDPDVSKEVGPPPNVTSRHYVTIFHKAIESILSNGDGAMTAFVMHWLAHLVQRPGIRTGVPLLLRGSDRPDPQVAAAVRLFLQFLVEHVVGLAHGVIFVGSDTHLGDRIRDRVLVIVDEDPTAEYAGFFRPEIAIPGQSAYPRSGPGMKRNRAISDGDASSSPCANYILFAPNVSESAVARAATPAGFPRWMADGNMHLWVPLPSQLNTDDRQLWSEFHGTMFCGDAGQAITHLLREFSSTPASRASGVSNARSDGKGIPSITHDSHQAASNSAPALEPPRMLLASLRLYQQQQLNLEGDYGGAHAGRTGTGTGAGAGAGRGSGCAAGAVPIFIQFLRALMHTVIADPDIIQIAAVQEVQQGLRISSRDMQELYWAWMYSLRDRSNPKRLGGRPRLHHHWFKRPLRGPYPPNIHHAGNFRRICQGIRLVEGLRPRAATLQLDGSRSRVYVLPDAATTLQYLDAYQHPNEAFKPTKSARSFSQKKEASSPASSSSSSSSAACSSRDSSGSCDMKLSCVRAEKNHRKRTSSAD